MFILYSILIIWICWFRKNTTYISVIYSSLGVREETLKGAKYAEEHWLHFVMWSEINSTYCVIFIRSIEGLFWTIQLSRCLIWKTVMIMWQTERAIVFNQLSTTHICLKGDESMCCLSIISLTLSTISIRWPGKCEPEIAEFSIQNLVYILSI